MGKEYISESKSWAAETERRIAFLHVDYEVTRLELQHNGASIDATGSVNVNAEHEFSNLAEVDVNQTRARRASARPYVCFAKHDCGLGYLLMLGTQTRKHWERTITNEGISWILQFCEEEEELRSVFGLARKLQPLACTIVEEGFCGTDKGELRETGHIFSAQFKSQDFSEVNTGLETLAAAANVMQSCAFPVERRDSAIASQLQLNETPYPVSSIQMLHGTAPSAVYSEPHADSSQWPMGPQNASTHVSHFHHCDDQAVELLGGPGRSWTNGYLASSEESGESRLAARGLANSSYVPMNGHVTSEALPHWRPLNQAQDMWQGNDMAPEDLAEWDAFWSCLSQPQQFDSIVT
ncbi:hypothetical protein LTR54_018313 [Friedmanniomyces endolithicus]|uniref:Uncharacterized protein n=1 Tax=Friedmanniomyces endolithicus TaxID=329885 RepID=A0AAN6F5K3_9PEZI|nr:hypothetical protein LTR82_018173 [Friedmanniomyces endolithicus]KAK0966628.1 hypothetical protein LTR54_018313 [Friedmanniomyces endolithicus]